MEGRKPGRPKGSRNKATVELQELARKYTPDALKTLRDICINGEGESARVSAAQALLDRGHGKAPQPQEHKGELNLSVEIVNGLGD